MKVEIYSDVACPWCYIGERRFARALAALPAGDEVEVVFKPYQLDPDAPETAVPMAQYLTRRFNERVDVVLSRVTDTAASEGLRMDWDAALAVNTRTAHRLARLAEREYGPAVQRALMEQLFEAHFSRGVDVSDHDSLTKLAVSVGMDEARVTGYLRSDEGADELEAEFVRARAAGVQAVPTFIFNGQYAVQGGQPASTFLQVLEEVQRRSGESADADSLEPERPSAAAADACADGSCAVEV